MWLCTAQHFSTSPRPQRASLPLLHEVIALPSSGSSFLLRPLGCAPLLGHRAGAQFGHVLPSCTVTHCTAVLYCQQRGSALHASASPISEIIIYMFPSRLSTQVCPYPPSTRTAGHASSAARRPSWRAAGVPAGGRSRRDGPPGPAAGSRSRSRCSSCPRRAPYGARRALSSRSEAPHPARADTCYRIGRWHELRHCQGSCRGH